MPRGRPTVKYENRERADRSKNRFLIRMASLEATLDRDLTKILSDAMFEGERAQVGASNSLKWQAKARRAVAQEMRFFAEEAVQPTFRQFAPVRDWGSQRPPGGRRTLLRDTIQAVVNARRTGPELTIKSGWWAKYATERRGALPELPGNKVYKLVLPGGVVIYRKHVGPATQRAFSTGEVRSWVNLQPGETLPPFPPRDAAKAAERMNWPVRAWKSLQDDGTVKVLTGNLVEAILHGETGEGSYEPNDDPDNESGGSSAAKARTAAPPKSLSTPKAKAKKEAVQRQGGGGVATQIGLSAFDAEQQRAMRAGHNAMIIRDKTRQIAKLEETHRDYLNAAANSKAAGSPERAAQWIQKAAEVQNRLQHLHQEIATLESGI